MWAAMHGLNVPFYIAGLAFAGVVLVVAWLAERRTS